VDWWLVAAKSAMLSKRKNKISVSRTSSVLGGSRTRSVLGGSGLGGDDRALVAAPMGAISLVLGCDLAGARCDETVLLVRSPCCFSLSLSSIFLRPNSFKGKYKRKWFYRVRRHILRLTEMIFRLTQFSLRTQTPAFTEKYFQK